MKAIGSLLTFSTLIGCPAQAPIASDSLVSLPVATAIAVDGEFGDWSADQEPYFLRTEGEAVTGAELRISHNLGDDTLFLALAAPGPRPAGVDIFLDVSGDTTLDRPVQLAFGTELAAMQEQHLPAARAAYGEGERRHNYEWSINLKKLGFAGSLTAAACIGFDVEIEMADGSVAHWGGGTSKGINKRRLSRLSLLPAESLYGSVTGRTSWKAGSALTSPRRVHVEMVDNPQYSLILPVDDQGAFRGVLPVGSYSLRAMDSRSVQSLSEPTLVTLDSSAMTLEAPLRLRRPTTSLERLVPELMEQENVRAVAVAYLDAGAVSTSVFGVQANGEPATNQTLFKMASVSKPVAAMVVLALAERLEWDLDIPLSSYWVDPDVEGRPELAVLTARAVLRHVSGLPNSRGETLTFSAVPGLRQSYSGEGFRYLRRAVEAKFGRSFQSLAEEFVFEPAGMTDSTFSWPAGSADRLAGKFYGAYEFDLPKRDEANIVGGLYSTARDLGRFLAWTSAGAGLSPGLWADMVKPNSVGLLEDPNEDPRRHGLSWVVYGEQGTVLTHGGNEMGARAYLAIVPSSQSGLAVVVNGSGGVPVIRAVFEATLKASTPLEGIEAEFERWDGFDQ